MIQTIRDWIESILGTYTPISYTQTIIDADGVTRASNSVIPNGVAGLDWSYIVTACLLLVAIYSAFRIMGILLQSICGGTKFRW